MADTSAVVTEDYVEALKRRVEVLEKKLLPREAGPPVMSLTSAVRELEKKLDALGGKEKGGHVKQLWGKIDQLENVLAPEYSQQLKLTEDTKRELLMGQVSQLRQFSERMEEVHHLKDYINSTECQGLEGHEKKLASVAAAHSEQDARVQELARQARELMEGYRQLMLQLSSQCVQWDEVLRKHEAKS